MTNFRHRGLLKVVVAVSLAAATAATIILVTISRTFQIAQILHTFAFALIYSCSIGFPAAAMLFALGRKSVSSGKSTGLVPRLAVLLAANVVGCLVAGILAVAVGLNPIHEYWTEFRSSFVFSTVITLTFGLSVSFYQEVQARLEIATLELRTRQMEEERARKLVAETRLASLESRLHPHFLFNTLNSISALIPKDPKRAEDMVGQLAALLRFSLNANQAGLVPLRQELEIVRAYLEIEKARFDARLRYSVDVSEEAETIGVPPFSVESLVENSIKHVIAQRSEGGEIRVRAYTQDDRLELEVSDSGPGFALDLVPAGHGLDNLSGRLALLFGERARLESSHNGKHSTVRVSLPCQV